MDHLPIFLNLKNARALVVGNGTIAARKADLLLRAGCSLTVIAPELSEELVALTDNYSFEHKTADLSADDLKGCVVVFGCCKDDAVNQKLYDLATEAGILVNVSDNTENCSFIMQIGRASCRERV